MRRRRGIAHLWNHRVVLYRAVAPRDQYGDTVEGWTAEASPAGLNARPDEAWAGSFTDHGPGEQPGTTRRWFLDKTFGTVRARDVLDVVEGPEAPLRIRAISVTLPTAPLDVHHIEVAGEVWDHELTPAVP